MTETLESEQGFCPKCGAEPTHAQHEYTTYNYAFYSEKQYYTCAECGAFFFVEAGNPSRMKGE